MGVMQRVDGGTQSAYFASHRGGVEFRRVARYEIHEAPKMPGSVHDHAFGSRGAYPAFTERNVAGVNASNM